MRQDLVTGIFQQIKEELLPFTQEEMAKMNPEKAEECAQEVNRCIQEQMGKIAMEIMEFPRRPQTTRKPTKNCSKKKPKPKY